jgi:hypothetical protein
MPWDTAQSQRMATGSDQAESSQGLHRAGDK